MTNESQEHQVLFLNSFYRSFGLRVDLDLTWFRWFYMQNPLGYCNNYILVDLATTQWIGGFGFAKKSYCANGNRVIGGLGVNGFVNPGYEGLGLYTELISTGLEEENYLDRGAFSFPHNRNIASIKGHLKSGWQSSISLSFIEKPIHDPERDDAEILCSSNPEALGTLDFERLEPSAALAFPRDYSELSWRYWERPDRQYRYVTLSARDEMGYMILGTYVSKEGRKRCEIADCRSSSPDVLRRLIGKASFVAAEEAYHILDVLINPDSQSHAMFQDCGFRGRHEGYELLTHCRRPLMLPRDIAVSYGDFDVV